MNVVWTIAQRDFKGFFGTAVGWIAACLIFLGAGSVFAIITWNLLGQRSSMDPVSDIMQNLIGFVNYINIFIVPVFTMRAMTDELANGTYRIQAAAPISTWEIVLGKFFGIMFYFGVIALLMLVFPLFVVFFAEPDFAVMASGWLGIILHIAAVVSISLFVASLTKNSVISYLGSAILILLVLFSTIVEVFPEWYRSNLNLLELANGFAKGMIKTSALAVYFSICGIFLFLSRLVLESKRWRF